MVTIASGSRLVLRTPEGPVAARSLAEADLSGSWCVPVLVDADVLVARAMPESPSPRPAAVTGPQSDRHPAISGVAEFSTDAGPVRRDADLVPGLGSLILRRAALRVAALSEQRREHVRGPLSLPVRGALLSTPAIHGPRDGARRGGRPVLTGETTDVSAGGLGVRLSGLPASLTRGDRVYLELQLPNGELAPAVAMVLERDGDRLRTELVDVSALDRERLVRLVFALQRKHLARRTRELT
jgi:hypothetical protein